LVMTQSLVQCFKISCSSHRHCGNYLHRVCSSEHFTKLWIQFQCLQKTPQALFFH